MKRFFQVAALAATLAPTAAWAQSTGSWAGTQLGTTFATNFDSFGYARGFPADSGACRASSNFYGTSLSNDTGATGAGANATGLQCGNSNPSVTWNLTFRPRYRINRMFQLRFRWDLNVELTDTVETGTTTKREPRFGDPSVDLWATGFPAVGPFRFALSAGAALPGSVESRFRGMIVSPRVTGQVAFGAEILGGEFAAIGQVVGSVPLYTATTPSVRGDFPYPRMCYGGGTSCLDQGSGTFNVAASLSWVVILAQTWGKWSPGFAFQMIHQFPYGPSNSDTVHIGDGLPAQTVRNQTYFAGWVDYNPNAWLTVELGYQLFRPLLNADGTIGNPIWDERQYPQVYVNLNMVIDRFFYDLTHGSGGAGGVIRTQNNTPQIQHGFARF